MAVSLGRRPPKLYRGRTKVWTLSFLDLEKVVNHSPSLTVRITIQAATKVGISDHVYRRGL